MLDQKRAFFLWIVLLVMLFILLGNKPDTMKTPAAGSRETQKDQFTVGRHWKETKMISAEISRGIKRFVFVLGYHGNGRHSLVGMVMGAHPHVVISHKTSLVKLPSAMSSPEEKWREAFFKSIYKNSISAATVETSWRGKGNKTDHLWQGSFDKYIDVIGEESGGAYIANYLENKAEFIKHYKRLKAMLSIPVSAIHVLQNPFDIIPTVTMTIDSGGSQQKRDINEGDRLANKNGFIDQRINTTFWQINALVELTEDIFGRENVLDVHNCDLAEDPRGTISKIFEFLDVRTTEHYLDECAEKVFKSVSRPRDTITWTTQQIETVERRMHTYKMLNRYSFNNE